MYEIRQKKMKELKQKPWFNYALLAVAVYVFSQGNAILRSSTEIALPVILISFILHARSVGNITEKILKIKSNSVANTAMLVALFIISAFCYFYELKLPYIILLDFASIAVYAAAAFVCNKLKTGEH